MEDEALPWGFHWRSHRSFIIATVAIGLFTDLFLYGIIIPVVPFMLRDRVSVPEHLIQTYTSQLLATYAGSSVFFSVPAGWAADKVGSRRIPFLFGLGILLGATAMLGFGTTMPILIIARLLQGSAAAIVWSVGFAMIQDLVGPSEMGQVIGTIFSLISVGELVAPVIGGVLYDHGGMLAVFGVGCVVLLVDLVMRLLIIERPKPGRVDTSSVEGSDTEVERDAVTTSAATETDTLLPRDTTVFKIPEDAGWLAHAAPVVYCLGDSRLLMAFCLSFIQGSIIGVFDATVPTEAADLFHFPSRKVGLLFIALTVPYVTLATPAGWAVDRFGTKVVATTGYGISAPSLVLLALPSMGIFTGTANLAFFCAFLTLNGIALAIVGSPAIVEAAEVIEGYHTANPGFFGKHGPYAQLYGFNSMFFFGGLAAGPLVSGALRDYVGFHIMAFVFAGVAAIASTLSFLLIGRKR